jgi:DNA-binding CsgD family transcriptional regulator
LFLFDQALQASARGQGAVLLVSGPVGSGKTTLVQAMAARANQRGNRSFVIMGSAEERFNELGVLRRLVQSMCRAGMADPFLGGAAGDEDFFVMMERLGGALREFAADRPTLVGIDDVHYADAQSLRALSCLVPRIESSGVVLVLNESTSHERETAGLRAGLLHLPFCHVIRLAPLTCDDVTEQLRRRLGDVPHPASVRFCARVSGGSPLLLRALIDDLATVPDPCDSEPGPRFRQAVARSLHRCPSATAAVARASALLGDHATPELVAELSSVDAGLVAESLRDLGEMGLVEGRHFRTPHVRAAVLADIPVPGRSEMHRRAAELLHQSGAPASAVAEHLIAAHDGGRAPWRVVILCEAAREAMTAGDVDSAVLSLRHAVSASSDETERARAGVLLAQAQWHADPGRAARRLDELGRDARSGLFTGPDAVIAVNQLLWWGEFAQADELLRLAGRDQDGDSSLVHLWAVFGRAGGGTELAGKDGPTAHVPLAQCGPMAVAGYLNSAVGPVLDGARTDHIGEILTGIQAGAPLTPALYVLVALVQAGRIEETISWCDRLLKEEWIDRTPMRRAMIGTIEAVAMLRSGDSGGALRCVQEVFDSVPPASWGVVAGLPLSIAIRASVDLGDTDTARSYLAVPLSQAMFETPFALPYLLAHGGYHLAMGHPETGRIYTRSCLELLSRWGVGQTQVASEPPEPEAPDPPPAEAGDAGDHAVEALREAGDGSLLTDAEQRVAALVAAGNTNRQIAGRLFITVSTVEQHLTKIYRKLNVRSRSGLRRKLS